MNEKFITISDRIARNEDITMDEFKFIKGYIFNANKGKTWNPEDVVSNFVLDVRENYNPDMNKAQKEAWIYAHIKHAITTQARFDAAWTLYNPIPVPINWYEMEWWTRPEVEFQINLENEELEKIWEILWDWLEKEIYTNCIIWNMPIAYIAREHWKSSEWWRVVKEKIYKKIKEYIENNK